MGFIILMWFILVFCHVGTGNKLETSASSQVLSTSELARLSSCFFPACVFGKEGIGFPGIGVEDRSEPQVRTCWELSLGPLEEHLVLLSNKPFLQPLS